MDDASFLPTLTSDLPGRAFPARIGQDRLEMDSKSQRSGKPHKSILFNVTLAEM
jgi:hypothetical protein